jgi:Phytanoyl-CoA dioxygenase (PhyH)
MDTRRPALLQNVRNLVGRDKWDWPDDFVGQKPVRINHKAKLHSTMFPSPQVDQMMWLDHSWDAVESDHRFTSATGEQQEALRAYYVEGYHRVDALFDGDEIDRVSDRYREAWADGSLTDGVMGRRSLNPQRFVPAIVDLFADRRLLKWIELFMGRSAIPFQTIVGEWGTEQEIHTDAIHQTTFPLGFHVSAWLACQDIEVDAGPLFYYPRSHRLPYALAADVGIRPEAKDRSGEYREKYIPFIEDVVAEHRLRRKVFLAKKGDVLIWHHNLLHGGSAIIDQSLNRRSMALFFYGTGVLHYHDLSGDRAAMPTNG